MGKSKWIALLLLLVVSTRVNADDEKKQVQESLKSLLNVLEIIKPETHNKEEWKDIRKVSRSQRVYLERRFPQRRFA